MKTFSSKQMLSNIRKRFSVPVFSRNPIALFFATFVLFLSVCPAYAQEPTVITLQEGLRFVLEESRNVKIARLQESMAESDSHVARSALLPRIDASASHTSLSNQPALLYNGQAIPSSDQGYLSYSISIQQTLFDFRGSLSHYEASLMLLTAKKYDSARIQDAIAFEFTLSFYDFLEATHLVETAASEIEQLEAHFRDATSLYNAGVITRNDLLQVQVRLSDAKQRLISAENLRSFRAAQLNNLLLRPLRNKIQAVEIDKNIFSPTIPDLDGAWKIAAARRPEIQIVDATLKSINLEMTSQKAEFLPKIFVRGSNDYMENSYLAHENNWSFILGMNINLFEGGKSRAELQKSKSREKQLLEQRARLIDDIKLELQRYILDWHNAYARITATKDAVSQAQENLRINKRRYEEGKGTATEVLDAVTLLSTAETNHIKSLYDYRKAEAAVHYAMGTDLLSMYGR